MPLPTARHALARVGATRGQGPVLVHAPTCKSVACFGAVNVRTGKLCTALESKFNAITFGRFLRRLLKHHGSGKRMVVVLDNAKYHHA